MFERLSVAVLHVVQTVHCVIAAGNHHSSWVPLGFCEFNWTGYIWKVETLVFLRMVEKHICMQCNTISFIDTQWILNNVKFITEIKSSILPFCSSGIMNSAKFCSKKTEKDTPKSTHIKEHWSLIFLIHFIDTVYQKPARRDWQSINQAINQPSHNQRCPEVTTSIIL